MDEPLKTDLRALAKCIPPNWPFRAADIEAITGMRYNAICLSMSRTRATVKTFVPPKTRHPTTVMMVQFGLYRALVQMGFSAEQSIVLALSPAMDRAIREAIDDKFIFQSFVIIAPKENKPGAPLDYLVVNSNETKNLHTTTLADGTKCSNTTSFRLINISQVTKHIYETITQLFPHFANNDQPDELKVQHA